MRLQTRCERHTADRNGTPTIYTAHRRYYNFAATNTASAERLRFNHTKLLAPRTCFESAARYPTSKTHRKPIVSSTEYPNSIPPKSPRLHLYENHLTLELSLPPRRPLRPDGRKGSNCLAFPWGNRHCELYARHSRSPRCSGVPFHASGCQSDGCQSLFCHPCQSHG